MAGKIIEHIFKCLTVAFILAAVIVGFNKTVYAAEYRTTMNSEYREEGYHLEEAYRKEYILTATDKYWVGCFATGLFTEPEVLKSSVRWSNLTGSTSFYGGTYEDAHPGIGEVGSVRLRAHVDKAITCKDVTIASGYEDINTGLSGYAYFKEYYAYCDVNDRYYWVGSAHTWLGTVDGDIGNKEYHPADTEVTVITYNIVPDNYILTLNPNGGSIRTDKVTLTYDSSDYYEMNWNIPVRDGYEFDGWFTSASGGTKVYDASGYVTNEGKYWEDNTNIYPGSYTLYAHWTSVEVPYKVIHRYPDIGGGHTDVTEEFMGQADTEVTPTVKEKEGFINPQEQTVVIKPDGSTEVVYEYTRKNYSMAIGLKNSSGLTYNDYGSFDVYINGELVADDVNGFIKTVSYGSEYRITDIKAKKGHTYDGISGTGTQENGIVDGIVTLCLNYHINTYTVCFDPNGGTDGPEEVLLRYDEVYKLTETPSKTGYAFRHWNTLENGKGTGYPLFTEIKSLTEQDNATILLYAQWTQRRFELVKSANSWHGGTFVKRMPGDEEWYNNMGKHNINDPIPDEYIIQEWVIDNGEIRRMK